MDTHPTQDSQAIQSLAFVLATYSVILSGILLLLGTSTGQLGAIFDGKTTGLFISTGFTCLLSYYLGIPSRKVMIKSLMYFTAAIVCGGVILILMVSQFT